MPEPRPFIETDACQAEVPETELEYCLSRAAKNRLDIGEVSSRIKDVLYRLRGSVPSTSDEICNEKPEVDEQAYISRFQRINQQTSDELQAIREMLDELDSKI